MRPIRFGLIGEYQSGKSLFINCLLQRSVATVGGGNATTHTVVNYQYGEQECVKFQTTEKECSFLPINEFYRLDTATNILVVDVFLRNDLLRHFTLTDMPGFGANEADNEMARKVLPKIDFAILIASSDKSFGSDTDSFRSLHALKDYRISYFFVLNCTKTERWRCDDEGNLAIANQDMSMLSFYPPERYPLKENGLNIVNLMWYWYSICKSNDELINRKTSQNALAEYGIEPSIKEQLGEVSNFNLIKKLFDMENRNFLELKRSIREEIESLKRELCPVGTIQAFAFNRIPEGWLICDGRSLAISEYPLLYKAIGNMFGSACDDDFRLPNLCGRFIRGWDSTGKVDNKRIFGSEQDDSIQIHRHEFSTSKLKVNSAGDHTHTTYASKEDVKKPSLFSDDISMLRWLNSYGSDTGSTSENGNHTHDLTATSSPIGLPTNYGEAIRYSGETRPKNIALLFCIKYK